MLTVGCTTSTYHYKDIFVMTWQWKTDLKLGPGPGGTSDVSFINKFFLLLSEKNKIINFEKKNLLELQNLAAAENESNDICFWGVYCYCRQVVGRVWYAKHLRLRYLVIRLSHPENDVSIPLHVTLRFSKQCSDMRGDRDVSVMLVSRLCTARVTLVWPPTVTTASERRNSQWFSLNWLSSC